jgi:hypothetical protein
VVGVYLCVYSIPHRDKALPLQDLKVLQFPTSNSKPLRSSFQVQIKTALSPSQNLFLTNFVGTFPLESIKIPGPLVPFFRSISAAAPGFGNFQEVLPGRPSLCCRENRLFSLDFTPPDALAPFDGIAMMLPHIPLMMDQFIHLIKYISFIRYCRSTAEVLFLHPTPQDL